MATLSICLHPHEKKGKLHTILFRLTINRKLKYESSGYSVRRDQFRDGLAGWVIHHSDAVLINRNLEIRRSEIMKNLMDAEAGLLPLTHETVFKGKQALGLTIGELLKEKIDYYEKRQSHSAFIKYISLKKDITAFFQKDPYLAEFTPESVNDFEVYLKDKNGVNTIKKKFSRLAGLIDTAKDRGRYAGMNAFKLTRIGAKEVSKPSLTWREIRAIEGLKLTGTTDKVRDMFIFSFYGRGMRFGDCIAFERSSIKDKITYTMQKNGKEIVLERNKTLNRIIKKYAGSGRFLFDLIDEMPDKWHWDDVKGSLNAMCNAYLKRIAIQAGIEKNLSFHVARHTFAQLLKQHQSDKGQSNIYTIQEALAHSDVKTTQKYLKSLGNSIVDKEVAEMFKMH